MYKDLYRRFYAVLRNTYLATAAARIFYALCIAIYHMKALSVKKETIFMDAADARETVASFKQKPESQVGLYNQPPNEALDISIIVAVYQAERYLKQCLDSLANQNTQYRYEVICVNDGSTDRSGEILNAYAAYGNFRVLRQANQGAAAAKNTGLNEAKGRYIAFVDSDDFVGPSMVEELLNAAYAKDLDIVQYGYTYCYEDGTIAYPVIEPYRYIENATGRALIGYSALSCTNAIRRTLFYSVRFPVGYWYEDTTYHFLLFREAKRFCYIPKSLYYYRYNSTGTTAVGRSSNKALDTYYICEWALEESRRLAIGNEESLYVVLLKHMGRVLYGRTKHLDETLLKSVFVLACELIRKNRPDRAIRLSHMEKQLEKSLIGRNYNRWKLVSRYF